MSHTFHCAYGGLHHQRHQPDRRHRRSCLRLEQCGIAGFHLPVHQQGPVELCHAFGRYFRRACAVLLLQRVRQCGACPQDFHGRYGKPYLGLYLSFLAIKYSQHNTDIMPYTEGAFLIAFSTLIIPAFDVVRVVLVRIREGHSPFEPDKNHIHHKLLAIGLSREGRC